MIICRRTLWALIALLLKSASWAGVDLTPTPIDVVEDGVKFQQLRFKSDEGTVLLTPPAGWSFSGGPGRLLLKPAGKDFADALIETVALPAPAAIDEAVRAEFKQQVLAGLPPGSDAVATVSETENAVMPGGNPSFEVVVSYKILGKSFQRNALLVHTPRERLLFRLTAQTGDYLALLNEFRRSTMSWQYVEARPPQSAPSGGS